MTDYNTVVYAVGGDEDDGLQHICLPYCRG